MKNCIYFVFYWQFLIIIFASCKQPYDPPIKKNNLGYLVVDGVIVNGADSTIINLSRTQNITDSNYVANAEKGALVTVVGQNAESYPLIEETGGKYISSGLNLNSNETYQLKIVTTNGNVYMSDSIPVKQTPAIDSVTWLLDNSSNVDIYVNTHDPANNTRYYRWEYSETWEYQSIAKSNLIYKNGMLQKRNNTDEDVFTCWATDYSTEVLLGSSEKLSQDVIYQQPIITSPLFVYVYPIAHQLVVPWFAQKFSREYSVLIKQFAITKDAYNYWQQLKQNTQEVGTLFAPQPGTVTGNIHCINVPSEPALGYISASSVTEKRIFIPESQIYSGSIIPPDIGCVGIFVPPDQIDVKFPYTTIYTPLDSVFTPGSDIFVGISAVYSFCADCTQGGGINAKPSYWPN